MARPKNIRGPRSKSGRQAIWCEEEQRYKFNRSDTTYNRAKMWPTIREMIGAGYTLKDMASALCVSVDTFKSWRKANIDNLQTDMNKAVYQNVVRAHRNVRHALEAGDLETSKWYLTKNAPRYRDRQVIDVEAVNFDDDVDESTALDTRDAARAVLFMLAKAKQKNKPEEETMH